MRKIKYIASASFGESSEIEVDDDVILKIIDCLIKEKNEQFEKDGVVF